MLRDLTFRWVVERFFAWIGRLPMARMRVSKTAMVADRFCASPAAHLPAILRVFPDSGYAGEKVTRQRRSRSKSCASEPSDRSWLPVRPALFKHTDSSGAAFVAVDFTRSKSVVALARLRSQSKTSMTARLNPTKRV